MTVKKKSKKPAPSTKKTPAGTPSRGNVKKALPGAANLSRMMPVGGQKKAAPAEPVPPRKMPKIKITAAQKKEYKDRLLSLREKVTGQIASLKGDSLQRADDVNSEEDGTDAFERQFALTLASNEQDALFEIDEALRRIEEGLYGVCLQCYKLIEVPRLKALPFVKMCVRCQSELEKGRRGLRQDEAVAYHAETPEPEEAADNSDAV